MQDHNKIEIPSNSALTSADTIIVTEDWPDGSPSNQTIADAKLEAKSPTASDRTSAFIRQSSKQASGLSDADARELEALLGAEDLEEAVPGQAARLNQFGLYASDRRSSGTSLPNDASPAPK